MAQDSDWDLKHCPTHNYIYKFMCIDQLCMMNYDVMCCAICANQDSRHIAHKLMKINEFQKISDKV